MYVELPTTGCNYFSSPTGFTNYYNGVATTYIIIEGKAVRTRTSSYTSLPAGYICQPANSIPFKPEFLVYSQFMAIILCTLIGVLLWKTLGRILGR